MKKNITIVTLICLLILSIGFNIHQKRIINVESKWCQMYWEEVEKSLSLEWKLESIKLIRQ